MRLPLTDVMPYSLTVHRGRSHSTDAKGSKGNSNMDIVHCYSGLVKESIYIIVFERENHV